MNRVQMKAAAKQQIKGNIGILFLMELVISLIIGAANSVVVAVGCSRHY